LLVSSWRGVILPAKNYELHTQPVRFAYKKFFFQVAEFANVRKQLEVLEERLDEMVQPRLVDALSNRKVCPTKQ
jgi:Tfp pilus assembly protein PilO